MSSAFPIQRGPQHANAGGLRWVLKKVIDQSEAKERENLVALLGARPEWAESEAKVGKIGFLKAKFGTWYVAYSGRKMDGGAVNEINKLLQGNELQKHPYSFINGIEVHPDFKFFALCYGQDAGCAEKKLMSFFYANRLEPELETMSAWGVENPGTANAKALYVEPCLSCQHSIFHFFDKKTAMKK